jgi:UDP-N-acetylmuramoyl-tripeptide--D-alanyl-D-alanine ligase
MTTVEQLYDIYLRYPSVKTDTRQLQTGDLFFALRGPSFNGNNFAHKALELGAAYAVIDEIPPRFDDRFLLVPDVLTAMQDLALYHRRQFDIPFIAITGSNGKTTTKELVHAALSSTYITYTTKGNLNNHIGIPLTLLSVRRDAEFAVIEMGANHQKEIAGYCRYTLPTHGIITNIGLAHLEGFGGPGGVKKGKGELFDHLRDNGGTAFVWRDSDDLRQMSRGIPHIVTYGTRDADVTGEVVTENDNFLHVNIVRGASTGAIHTRLVGDYNLPNVLVAVTIAKHFGVTDARIKKAIESYLPSNSRSQLLERDGNHIILDAYNANPSSMRAAIENFARLAVYAQNPNPLTASPGTQTASPGTQTASPGTQTPSPAGFDRKVLILGAMAELGPESLHEHQGIVDLIGKYPWHDVILVGGDFLRLKHPYKSFPNSTEAAQWLKTAGLRDAWLLIKGSRASKMEAVLGTDDKPKSAQS